MGQLNALEMVNELISRFNLPSVTDFSSQDAILALGKLNLAQNIISTSHEFPWAMSLTPGELTAVEGTITYNLTNTDVSRPISAKHNYNGGGVIRFVSRQTLETYRPDRSQTSDRGTTKVFCINGMVQSGNSWLFQVEAWPVPGASFASQIMYYYYQKVLAKLVSTADVSQIPDNFDWLLIDVANQLFMQGPGRSEQTFDPNIFATLSEKIKKGLKK